MWTQAESSGLAGTAIVGRLAQRMSPGGTGRFAVAPSRILDRCTHRFFAPPRPQSTDTTSIVPAKNSVLIHVLGRTHRLQGPHDPVIENIRERVNSMMTMPRTGQATRHGQGQVPKKDRGQVAGISAAAAGTGSPINGASASAEAE